MDDIKESLKKGLKSISGVDLNESEENEIVTSMSRVLRSVKDTKLGERLRLLLEDVEEDMLYDEIFEFFLNNLSEEQLKGVFALFHGDEHTAELLQGLFEKP